MIQSMSTNVCCSYSINKRAGRDNRAEVESPHKLTNIRT